MRLLNFGLKSANTAAWCVFQRLLPETPTPERCVEAYHLQWTRFEKTAERKLRRRQLTEDGNVEMTGRDLREGTPMASRSARLR